MMRRLLGCCIAAAALLSGGGQARANVLSGLVTSYPSAYSIVGGPAGTDFSSAAAFYTYANGQYTAPSSKSATGCTGYWAYFVDPVNVALPLSLGPTQDCALQAGWNMVGDPFSGAAALPPGVTGWYWNHDRRAYDQVSVIPPGGSVFVNSATGGTITLTYVPAAGHVATEIAITPDTPGPVTLHVGDSVMVVMLASNPAFVGYDPAYIHADNAGSTYDLTCIGDPACELNPTSTFWLGHATAPGITFLSITPTCRNLSPPCSAPSRIIQLNILP
jgi:hypothetical protein